MTEDDPMIDVVLRRIVIREGTDRQYIYLVEDEGERGFPIVIGDGEAREIYRVVHGQETPRPLTHQLVFDAIQALGAGLRTVDIVDLRQNTFFAQLVLQDKKSQPGDAVTVVDARPSDAIAIALRARCRIRVADSVLARAAVPDEGADDQ